ncbi:MAG: thioredoxin domain-containing protein [Gammaproteobacteria bacterium]|nr:thioredoxin domain-containing protein [Gammaproteobacteria bacterium]
MKNIKYAFFTQICALLFLFIAKATAGDITLSSETESSLKQKLLDAFHAQPADYQPRTEHFLTQKGCESTLSHHSVNNKQPCYINRLILESSPYLLQHAHNPVNWFAWGKESLEKAKKENKPILLSIGYAACHWCHRMEKESFDNVEIAKILNKHFISIKVDRERRPDIDEFYANAVQYFQGQQGWPMTLFLTPDGKPFYGGSYYSYNEFLELLTKTQDDWNKKQQEMIQQAQQVVQELQQGVQGESSKKQDSAKLDEVTRRRAIKDLLSFVDGYHGGFGESQKFPREPWLLLLLDGSYTHADGSNSPINDSFTALSNSLDHMARGGIYDQLNGGFHRYSTDPYWKIPHFEKMLYNQALLVRLYLAANTIKPKRQYVRVIQQTLDFVTKEMQSPQGGFYSALDADTQGQEGYFYLWSLDEFTKALDSVEVQLATQLFDVDIYGETDSGKTSPAKNNRNNILYLSQSLTDFAQDYKISKSIFYQRVDKIRNTLLQTRNQRVKPQRDEKIIMGWNGLMISALAEGSRALSNPEYLQSAIKAADFIWNNMRIKKTDPTKEQAWYRVHFKTINSKPAQLEDYAYYLQALITLYDVTQKELWLERSEKLFKSMKNLLWDTKEGGFFQSPLDENAPLPIRAKSAFDKTLPSGNAVAAQMLLRLERRTGDQKYHDFAKAIFSTFVKDVYQTPSAFSGLHIASHELRTGQKQLPLYGGRGKIRIDAFLKEGRNDEQKTNYNVKIHIKLKDRWHINAHQPLQKHLIATKVELLNQSQWQLEKIQYPEHEIVKLGFSDEPLALYQGEVKINATLNKNRSKNKGNKETDSESSFNPVFKLSLQACSDDICLLPEQFLLFPGLLEKKSIE